MYHQLSEISPAISEIVVDGKYHYPSKVSQEAAAVLYPIRKGGMKNELP